MPVIDSAGALVGIITEGDFLRRSEIGARRTRPRWVEFFTSPGPLAEEYIRAKGRTVEELMSRDVCTVTEATALSEIAELMENRRIKRVPVMRQRELTGIITRADLLRAVIALNDTAQPMSGDRAIRKQLQSELATQSWAVPQSMVRFTVEDGAVAFSGVVRDERQRQALRVAAESIPGVKAVTDSEVRIEPVIGLFAMES